jgi:hypothetical protein
MKTTTMKTILPSLMFAFAVLVFPNLSSAAGEHAHEGKKIAGPNGGRVITAVEPHCEVLIAADRKLKVTFLGADNKPAPLKEQSLTGSGGDRSKPTKFTFVKSGDSLVSEQALPAGDKLPVILKIKTAPDAKAVTVRFKASMEFCGGCKLAEYACTCADHVH